MKMLNRLALWLLFAALAIGGASCETANATALSAGKEISGGRSGSYESYPVNASSQIYQGGLVCIQTSDGMAVAGSNAAARQFAGIAESTVVGGSSDGDVSVLCKTSGVFTLTASSGAATDVGKVAYLIDDATVGVALSTQSIPVGVVRKYNSATSLDVDITGFAGQNRTSCILPMAGTPLKIYVGSGAFTTTGTSVAVTAGGLTTVVAAFATPCFATAAQAANGQLTFTGTAGAVTVGGGNVTVTRIAGTDSGLSFNYVLYGTN